jgi:putative peptidoglycan lipid II flippase
MSKKHSIIQAVSILFLINIATKLVGLLRDRAIAVLYGATGTTDAFLVAQTIPALLTGALAGALGTAFLPVFAQFMAQDKKDEAWELSSGILTNILLVTCVLAGIGMVASEPIIRFFASGLSQQSIQLAVASSQILFPSIIFAAITAYLGGLLNSFKVFTAPALAPLLMNVTITMGIYLLVPGAGALSLAIATSIGTGVQILIQFPQLRKVRFRYRFTLGWNTPGIRRVAQLTWPVLLGAVLTQVYTLVDRSLASYLIQGSISSLNFAIKVLQLPLGLFVSAISTVLFPTFAELHSRKQIQELGDKVQTGIRSMAILILPAFIALGLLRVPVIQILFQKGAFDDAATQATSLALLCYLGAGIAQSYTTVINTAMFAMQNTLVSVIINAIGTIVNILLDLFLVKSMGFAGLALANSIASLIITAISFGVIKRYLPTVSLRQAFNSTLKILLSSMIMLCVMYLVLRYVGWEHWLGTNLGRIKVLTIAMAIGIPVYVTSLLPWKFPEVSILQEKVKGLFLRVNGGK